MLVRTTLVLLVLLSLLAPRDAFAEPPGASRTDAGEARIDHTDLVPPLPRDPVERVEAIKSAENRIVPTAAGIHASAGLTADARHAAVATPLDGPRHSRIPPMPAARNDVANGNTAGGYSLVSLGGFQAIDDTGFNPADLHLAAGTDVLIGISNDLIRIWDKCGTLLGVTSMSVLVGAPPGVYSGGRVIYDQWNDTFAMAFIRTDYGGGQGYVYWCYSSDGLSWTYYIMGASFIGTGVFADFIDIGADPNNQYLTLNRFNLSTFVFEGASLLVSDAGDFLDGGGTSFSTYPFGNNPGNGLPASAVRVAKMRSWGGSQYLINSEPGGGNFLTFWTFTGAASSGTLASTNLPLAFTYNPPAPAPQPDGTYIRMGDARLYDAVYKGGELLAVGGYDLGDASIAVWQVNASGASGSFAAFGTISGTGASAFPSVDLASGNFRFVNLTAVDDGAFPDFPSAQVIAASPVCCFQESVIYGPGLTNYDDGIAAGTPGDPFRWGNTSATCVDPSGDRVWVMGMFASDTPTPSWDSRVELVTVAPPPSLTMLQPPNRTISGVQGGPFSPPSLVYQLSNPGGTTLDWELTGLPWFLNASVSEGTLAPGADEFVTFTLDPSVYGMTGPLEDTQQIVFNRCLGNSVGSLVTLVIGVDTECRTAAKIDLDPGLTPTGQLASFGNEHGLFVTVMGDMLVCGVGFVADLPPGTTVRCRIYDADGNTRGALLHDESMMSYQTGMATHYVPFDLFATTFDACRDYNISFEFDDANAWDYWDEGPDPYPVDYAGLIRVRNADLAGNPAAPERIHIEVLGFEYPCEQLTELAPPGETPTVLPTVLTNRGMYVTPMRTIRLCSILFYASIDPTATVTARVYEASGTTRLSLLAESHFPSAGSGMLQQGAPMDIVLLEGEQYNLTIDYGSTADLEVFDETSITLPYDIGDLMRVRDGEVNGDAAFDTYLPNFSIEWGEVGGGSYIGLSPPTGTETVGTTGNVGRGLYVTPALGQQVYAVSWEADVPEGEPISAGVFEASGGVQGSLISQGTVFSTGPGRRWHTIPVSAEFEAGAEYNVVVGWADVNGYPQWTGSAFTYEPNGLTKVLGASDVTGAPATEVVHLRYRTCGGNGGTATAVRDTPLHAPMYLRPPSPNPATGTTMLSFQLEREGSVSLAVYDVKGRRVAEVLDAALSAGPHERRFDTRGLPSGVYFVRLHTPTASVTRKLVVSR